MRFHIISVSGGNFKNDDGEKVHYGSVMVIDDEVTKRDGFAGQEVKKMKADPDLIHHIKDVVPGLFDCQIDIVGKDSKVKVVSAKKVDSKVKAA